MQYLNRHVTQFAGKHDLRNMDTLMQMQHVVAGIVGRGLMYNQLIR